ncbi:P-loop containing nucleoside triphosphate hydrolase protein [Kalaharituber pfeilii]|nr:P-loop containing nucleoside triphosphate hydrolase protein [Kalaharituber pfeilii]
MDSLTKVMPESPEVREGEVSEIELDASGWPEERIDEVSKSGQFRRIYHRNTATTRQLRKDLADRFEARKKTWVEKSWQIMAASEVLDGHDTVVITATGSGKTLCYQSLAISDPDSVVLVISPLLALMKDQVESNERLGVKSCRLTQKTMRDNKDLIKRVAAGDYSIVLVGPEFINSQDNNFRTLLGTQVTRKKKKGSVFAEKLSCIVVDEVHLCYTWRTFRTAYADLGVVRSFFPKIPIMGLSATLSERALSFVHKTLCLQRQTSLIRNSIDHPNVFLTAVPIQFGNIMARRELNNVIPLGATSATDIRKTMIFVDSREIVCQVVDQLEARLAPELQGCELIMDFSTIISEERREMTMLNFQKNAGIRTRVMVCTEAAGMGVDVADVEVVIQWTIPSHVNLTSFWQRAGRCARNLDVQGIAILFYNSALDAEMSKVAGPGLRIYQNAFDGPESKTIWDQIQAFDEGVREGFERSGIVRIANTTEVAMTDNSDLVIAETPDVDTDPNSEILTESEPLAADFESLVQNPVPPEATISGGKRDSATVLKNVDRALLWFINTHGCRRQIILQYLSSDPEELAPATDPRCCDRCHLRLIPGIDYAETIGPIMLPPPNVSEVYTAPPRKTPTSKVQQEAVKSALHQFRKHLSSVYGFGANSFSDEFVFLSDDDINRISRCCTDVFDLASLQKVLTGKREILYSPLGKHVDALLTLLKHVLANITVAAKPTRGPRVGVLEVAETSVQFPQPPEMQFPQPPETRTQFPQPPEMQFPPRQNTIESVNPSIVAPLLRRFYPTQKKLSS